MKNVSTTEHTEKKPMVLSPTLENAEQKEDRQESGKLIDVEHIEGTPFTIVTISEPEADEQSFIAIGNSRLTEKMSYEKCKMLITDHNWELTLQMMVFIMDRMWEDYQTGLKIGSYGEKEYYGKKEGEE